MEVNDWKYTLTYYLLLLVLAQLAIFTPEKRNIGG